MRSSMDPEKTCDSDTRGATSWLCHRRRVFGVTIDAAACGRGSCPLPPVCDVLEERGRVVFRYALAVPLSVRAGVVEDGTVSSAPQLVACSAFVRVFSIRPLRAPLPYAAEGGLAGNGYVFLEPPVTTATTRPIRAPTT